MVGFRVGVAGFAVGGLGVVVSVGVLLTVDVKVGVAVALGIDSTEAQPANRITNKIRNIREEKFTLQCPNMLVIGMPRLPYRNKIKPLNSDGGFL